MQTLIMVLPQVADVSGSERWSDKPQELRRRQAERPIVPISEEEDEEEEDAIVANDETPATSPEALFVSSKSVPACFKSKDSCVNGTNDCSGKHGECRNKWAAADGSDGKDVCYTCHCLATRNSTSGSVTHWGGATCQKKDVSVPFWLFAGFTLFMVGILALAIGLLFNVGEEKLPGVIGAGVSRSK
jgi:hypothetical protein